MCRMLGSNALLLGLLMLLPGCGSSNSDAPAKLEPGVTGKQSQSILFDSDGTMSYLSGYDSIAGTVSTDPCFKRVTDITKDTSANPFANDYSYQMQMIESKTQLYDFLNASYQTDVNLGISKSKVAVEMSNQFKHESNSIYVLIKSTWDGPSFIVNDPKFPSADKTQFLALYPTYSKFVEACGDSFVYGIQTGMHFYGMFKFNFSSTSEKNRVHATLQNKTLIVKTKKELDNQMGFDTSTSNVTVIVKTLGGTSASLDASKVRTVGDFFAFVDKYAESEKSAIKAGNADGLAIPNNNLAYGYAINAVVVPYESFIRRQYGMEDSYFTNTLGSDWTNLKPIATQLAEHKDAYNQLNFVTGNPKLFTSGTDQNHSVTDAEITTLAGYKDKFKASYEGLEALMELCIEPDDWHTIKPNTTFTTINKYFTGTSRAYCKQLYNCTANPAASECGQCDSPAICPLLYSKLLELDEKQRMPFMTDSDVATLALPAMINEVPRDCKSLQASFPALGDGTYTVYYLGDTDKPFSVDCEEMTTSTPLTYLPLNNSFVSSDPANPTYNYSAYTDSTDKHEYRTWGKYRIVSGSAGVAIVTNDISSNTATEHSDPNNLNFLTEAFYAKSGGYDKTVSMNIDITGTGFALRKDNIIGVAGAGYLNNMPYLDFQSYENAATGNVYYTGITAQITGNPASLYVANPDTPHYLWLEYVSAYDVLANPADRKLHTSTLNMGAWGPNLWCRGDTQVHLCDPVYAQSIDSIVKLK